MCGGGEVLGLARRRGKTDIVSSSSKREEVIP